MRGLDTEHLEDVEDNREAVQFSVLLSQSAPEMWTHEFDAAYKQTPYTLKPPVRVEGDRLKVIFLPRYAGELNAFVNFLALIVRRANDELRRTVEMHTSSTQEQQKAAVSRGPAPRGSAVRERRQRMTVYISPEMEAIRPRIDAVIFDMDGVLLDISRSIRVVNCLAVAFYLREVLKWPAPDDLITSADIEMFKHAGGFNDDWDLTYALVLHYIAKGHENPDASPETLNVIQPKLARYASQIKERGGGLKAAEKIYLEHLSDDDLLAVEKDYRKKVIRQVFEELLAGEYTERLYGRTRQWYHGRGYINDDKVLIDLARIPKDRKLGVQTGRTWEEAWLGMEFTRLHGLIPDEHVVTKRDKFDKPHPGGLALLAERLGFENAIYIGDTLDDLRTVRAFNKLGRKEKLLGRARADRPGRRGERENISAGGAGRAVSRCQRRAGLAGRMIYA